MAKHHTDLPSKFDCIAATPMCRVNKCHRWTGSLLIMWAVFWARLTSDITRAGIRDPITAKLFVCLLFCQYIVRSYCELWKSWLIKNGTISFSIRIHSLQWDKLRTPGKLTRRNRALNMFPYIPFIIHWLLISLDITRSTLTVKCVYPFVHTKSVISRLDS